MEYAVVAVPAAPVRRKARHQREMVSQLLFGELIEILESNDDWVRIKSVADNYEGWCQPAHIMEASAFALPVERPPASDKSP